MRRSIGTLAVIAAGVVGVGCGSSSTSATPDAAVASVCSNVGKLNGDANPPGGGSPNTNALNDIAGNIAGDVSPLNPSGKATDAQKQLGTDALALAKQVQNVLTGGGSPQHVVDEITKVQGECSGLGH